MELWRALARLVDGIAEFLGRIGWLLILYCMIFGVTDVFLRYVMNAPSQWIGTTVQAAMVLIACTGGAYALKHDAFVKLDLFYSAAPERTKAVLDVLTAPFAFLFLAVLIWKGVDAAMMSIRLNQVTPTSIPIPIYPIKSAIPLTAGIVLLILLKKFFLDIRTIIQGEPAN
ncbi:MAG: TRAP transporter small permease subunit [Rhizobiaceae bacterium]|nr:TRAP transporter small permease subunit [Rhizobiaceae bacterium]MCV0404965.1 TRAP transporter small permease subunit [Rhizobiaceae bacterium]